MPRFRGKIARQRRNQPVKKNDGSWSTTLSTNTLRNHDENSATSSNTYTYTVTASTKTHKELEDLATATFNNHVIVERILLFLDYTSTKTLSAVSQNLKWIVRGNRSFLDRTRVRFFKPGPDGLKQPGPKPSTLNASDFPWKTVSIQLSTAWKREFRSIIRLVANVTTLELHAGSLFEATNWLELLATVLRLSPNVKNLTVDADVLDVVPVESFEAVVGQNTGVQANLRQLVSLVIKESIISNEKYGVLSGTNLGSNIKRLCEFPIALTGFGFERISYEHFGYNSDSDDDSAFMTASLLSILKKYKESLKSLSLDSQVWESTSISDLVFPSLKDLSIVTAGKDLPRVATFLNNQPPLQSLNLGFGGSTSSAHPLEASLMKHGPHLKKFSLSWKLVSIRHQILQLVRIPGNDNWGDQPVPGEGDLIGAAALGHQFQIVLHNLNLQAGVAGAPHPDGLGDPAAPNVPPPPPVPPAFSFSCLKNFGALLQVNIHQCASADRGNAEMYGETDVRNSLGSILSVLPDGIQEIDVRGTKQGIPNADLPQNIIESLSRFRNLTVLNLVQCPDVIDDDVLFFVCSQMKQLLELGFSHCLRLTDSGVTGKGKQSNAISTYGLKSLTGLRKLTIISCISLTRKGYLAALSFPDLRDLTLLTATGQLNQQFYVELLRNNKSLEMLQISTYECSTMPKLERTLKRQSPRFRSVTFIEPASEILCLSSEEEFWGSDYTSDMDDYGSDTDFDMALANGFDTDDDDDDDWVAGFRY